MKVSPDNITLVFRIACAQCGAESETESESTAKDAAQYFSEMDWTQKDGEVFCSKSCQKGYFS